MNFLILFHHSSLSSIALGRSSMPHPESVQSCCTYICSSWSHYLWSSVWSVHRSTSLISLLLLLQQCLVRLIWMVFKMGSRCLYSCCFVGCYLIQYGSQRSCAVAIKFFLYMLWCGAHIQQYWDDRCLEKCALYYRIGLVYIWLLVYR